MRFQGAVINEQGVTFAIVVVRQSVLNNVSESSRAMASFQRYFPGLPIVLMAQDGRGVPSYRGRQDIVNFLANVPLQAIPWREYTAA
jgi:hypothetical protein